MTELTPEQLEAIREAMANAPPPPSFGPKHLPGTMPPSMFPDARIDALERALNALTERVEQLEQERRREDLATEVLAKEDCQCAETAPMRCLSCFAREMLKEQRGQG